MKPKIVIFSFIDALRVITDSEMILTCTVFFFLSKTQDAKENGNTSDEMKKIDEDLYKSDVRNKSRYSRNFKKQPDCLKQKESMNDIVSIRRFIIQFFRCSLDSC